jgi:hypothetical protein
MEIRTEESEPPDVAAASALIRRDSLEHPREHRGDASLELGSNQAQRYRYDACQNRIFHGADTALIANKPADKLAHFYIPLT